MAPDQQAAMDPDSVTPSTTGPPTRRSLLRAGGLGLFATAFLAGCGKDEKAAGVSGLAATTTAVAPTVPGTEPTEVALDEDRVQLRTAQSVEVLVSDVYGRYGPRLADAELRDAAFRFQTDHVAAARVLGEAGGETKESKQANAYLLSNVVEPAAGSLTDDVAIANFMADLESALTATYISAAGVLTDAGMRQQVMSFGAASARRVAVLGGGGQGLAPTESLYPVVDLIPGDAFLGPKEDDAAGG